MNYSNWIALNLFCFKILTMNQPKQTAFALKACWHHFILFSIFILIVVQLPAQLAVSNHSNSKKAISYKTNVSDGGFYNKDFSIKKSCCGFYTDSSGNIQRCNNLFVGPSTIFEDSKPGFNTFGLNSLFTHPVSSTIGLTGDAGFHFGSSNGVDYTKLQLLAGASLLPANTNKIYFSPHLLAGVADVTSKFSAGNNTFKNSSAGFSLAAGALVGFPINNKITIAGTADYNPTFGSGGVKSNFRLGFGLDFHFSCGDYKKLWPAHHDVTTTAEECKASKTTKELKISLAVIKKTADAIEQVANKIPRVEAKIDVKPELNVKRGEECCSKDKPPVVYTELKGGVTGSCEVNINLWGLPDIKFEQSFWGVKLSADFKLKLFTGPTGKITLDGGGKFYGELGDVSRPDCKACYFLNIKAEGALRIGVVAGGKMQVQFGDNEPDEIGVSAEATASLVTSFTGTWGSKECVKPEPGVHGILKIGDGKANLKFNLDLGPLSFKPNYEVNLFDGLSTKVDVLF